MNFKEEFLTYDSEKKYLPADVVLNISPSSFSTFVERKHLWYRQNVLGLDKFEGSTSSVLGTIVHGVAAAIAQEKPVDRDSILEYVGDNEHLEDFSSEAVLSNYSAMSEALVNGYVLPNMHNYLETETVHCASLGDGVYVSGTLDVLEGEKDDCCITDYKTYNSKSKPRVIPQGYRYQLLVYAYMLSKTGYKPTRIKLVYVNRNIDGGISEKTGKPLKSYPPEITELVEEITSEDLEFIEGLLYLCKDSVEASKKYPELSHVIWNDPRLKQ